MTTRNSLSLTITSPAYGDETYWVKFIQEGKDDLATVADAADLIDAIFSIASCDDGTGQGGEPVEYDANGNVIPPIPEEEFIDIADQTLDIKACLAAVDYDWTAEVQVIRSHNTIPYTLVVEGGTVEQTVRIRKQVTPGIIFDHATSAELPYPVIDSLSGSWGTGSGNWQIKGGTVYLDRQGTGQLNLAYTTEYDLVSILIPGKDEELQEAELLAFWNRLAEPFTVSPPDIDASAAGDLDICQNHLHGEVEKEERPTECFENVYEVVKCQCSGKEVSGEWVERSVTCPDKKPPGSYLMGSRTVVTEYKDCGENDSASLGTYLERCCAPPPYGYTPPPCHEISRVWKPGAGIKPSKEHYIGLYGEGVEFVPISPKEGNCGELIMRWQGSHSCCADATQVVYDTTRSVGVLSDNSAGEVFFSGGLGPYHITVSGTGFWLDAGHTIKSRNISGSTFTVFTSSACGTCHVGISDYCNSQAVGGIRSVNGQWTPVLSGWSPSMEIGENMWVSSPPAPSWFTSEGIVGGVKTRKTSLRVMTTVDACAYPVRPWWSNQFYRAGCTGVTCQFLESNIPPGGFDPDPTDSVAVAAGLGSEGPTDTQTNPFSNIGYYMQYCSAYIFYPGVSWDVWEWTC